MGAVYVEYSFTALFWRSSAHMEWTMQHARLDFSTDGDDDGFLQTVTLR